MVANFRYGSENFFVSTDWLVPRSLRMKSANTQTQNLKPAEILQDR